MLVEHDTLLKSTALVQSTTGDITITAGTADGADAEDLLNTQLFERVDVGRDRDLSRQVPVTFAVPRDERDRSAAENTHHNLAAGWKYSIAPSKGTPTARAGWAAGPSH